MTFEQKYTESGFDSQRRYPNEGLIRFMAGYLGAGTRSEKKVLEIGCGSGANLWMVAKEGYDAFGIDLAPTGVELCQMMLESWGGRAALAVGNMMRLPYPEAFFDGIVDVVSMQHLSLLDHKQAMSEIHRCLKPGGLFYQWHLGDKSASFQKAWVH